jgi:hypothetical protein
LICLNYFRFLGPKAEWEKKGGPWIWCAWVVDCLLNLLAKGFFLRN